MSGPICPDLAFGNWPYSYLGCNKMVSVITWGVSRETSSCPSPLPSHNISRMSYHPRRRATNCVFVSKHNAFSSKATVIIRIRSGICLACLRPPLLKAGQLLRKDDLLTAISLLNISVRKILGSRFANKQHRFPDNMRLKMSGPNEFKIVTDSIGSYPNLMKENGPKIL